MLPSGGTWSARLRCIWQNIAANSIGLGTGALEDSSMFAEDYLPLEKAADGFGTSLGRWKISKINILTGEDGIYQHLADSWESWCNQNGSGAGCSWGTKLRHSTD